MSEDIFSIKDIRDIIIAFPPPDPTDTSAQSSTLVPCLGGDGFMLKHVALQQLYELLENSPQRLSQDDIAQRLDIDVDMVAHILALDHDRVHYDSQKQRLIPWPEFQRMLYSLRQSTRGRFVCIASFCSSHDVHNDSLLRGIRNLNAGLSKDDQLGTGKWYFSDATPNATYIYSSGLLDTTRIELECSLKNADETGEPKRWTKNATLGLDVDSFLCLLKKFASDTGIDSGHVSITSDGAVVNYIPHSFTVKAREKILETLPARQYFELLGILGEYADLFSDLQDLTDSLAGRFGQDVLLLNDVAVYKPALEKSVPAQVDQLLRDGFAQADWDIGLRPNHEGVMSFYVQAVIRAAQERKLDAIAIGGVDTFFVTEQWSTLTVDILTKSIEAAAGKAWEQYATRWAEEPEYPKAPNGTLGVTPNVFSEIDLPSVQHAVGGPPEELLLLVYNKHLQRGAKQIYTAAIAARDAENFKSFATSWKADVMTKLLLFNAGIENLELGKLRSELSSLLSEYVLVDLLSAGVAGHAMCGKLLSGPAGYRTLCSACQTMSLTLKDASIDQESFWLDVKSIFDDFARAMKISEPKEEDLAVAKRRETTLMAEIALAKHDDKSDKDGSRLYLVTILALLAKHQRGLLYATGRFVPRLLKLLKGKIDEPQFETLLALKNEVKSGRLSSEGRQVLQGILKNCTEER